MYSSTSRSQMFFSVGVGAGISSTAGVAYVGGIVLKSVGAAVTAGVVTGRSRSGGGVNLFQLVNRSLKISPVFICPTDIVGNLSCCSGPNLCAVWCQGVGLAP